MSQHSVELVAKFKDNATPGLRRLAAEAEKTGSRQLQKAAAVKLKHQEMYSATARLGIRTEHQIRREIQRTQAAYNRLAKSGAASQRDLARAAQATKSRIKELNAEINGGASRWQRIGSGFRSVGRGVAGAAAGTAAGAYVLAQPVNRTMDFDTALRHAANTMYAGKSMNEKRAGMEEIKKSVMDAAYVGGTTPEAALEAMNTMVASGAMSGEAVKKLLPTVMKTAAAANAEGNDIANIITKALQAGFKEADIPSLLDRALQSGADGGFELRDTRQFMQRQYMGNNRTTRMGRFRLPVVQPRQTFLTRYQTQLPHFLILPKRFFYFCRQHRYLGQQRRRLFFPYGRLNFRRQGSNQILLKFPAPSLTGILLKRPIIFLGIFIYCLSSFSG